jgi:hypothetical protein
MIVGCNIDPQHRFPKRGINDLKPQGIRFPIRYGKSYQGFTNWCLGNGHEPLPIVTNETFTKRELQAKDWWTGLSRVKWAYPRIRQIQIGNEPDQPDSPSSWHMGPDDFTDLLAVANNTWEGSIKIIAGGLVSGNSNWLNSVSFPPYLSTLAVHPYGKDPDTVIDLIDSYTRFGLPIWVTELGAEHGSFDDEHERAEWHTGMIQTLANYGVEATYVFAYSDRMGPFGLVDETGNPYESYASVKNSH